MIQFFIIFYTATVKPIYQAHSAMRDGIISRVYIYTLQTVNGPS